MIETFTDHLSSFIRLIFPDICASCHRDLYKGEEYICLHCRRSMVYTDHTENPSNQVYGMLRPLLPVRNAASAYYYGRDLIIQRLMYEVKYQGNRQLAVYLGNCLGNFLKDKQAWSDIDHLVPVPLHDRKRAKRGFNQSELICRGISEILDKPVNTSVLYRKKKTTTQTNQTRTDRWENVKNAFGLRSTNMLEGRHVLLVDDVITTGSTLQACAMMLLQIRGLSLSIASVAFAGEF